MPLLLLLLLLCTHTAFAQAGSDLLDRPVTLAKTTGTVQDLLRELSRQSGVAFSYSNQLPLGATVTLPRPTQPLRAHLDALFAGQPMEYLVRENKVILRAAPGPGVRAGGSSHALSGYVRDAASGEALAGASVYVPAQSVGTAANAYGFYSLSLPGGTYRVTVTFVGYRPDTLLVRLDQNQSLSIALQPAATQLDSVTVASPRSEEGPESVRTGLHHFDMGTLRKLPALAGEVDVMRSLQLLPGVNKAGEGSTGLYVRGGNADQNLVLLDEAPVYNTSHLLGVFSVFHPDIVKDVQLYKGGIPAQYGGRLSSVLDIRMKEGNARKLGVSGGIGLLSSRLTVEGPLLRDKTSFIIAARRTYPDLLLLNLNPNISGFRLNFYDLNAKINHTFNARNRLYLSGFFGRDLTQLGGFYNSQRVRWGNATGTLRWNHLFSQRLFSNFTLLYSQYRYRLQASPVQWQSRIEDVALKGDFTWYQSPRATFRFGWQSTHHRIDPGRSGADTLETGPVRVPGRNALEHALYLSHEQQLSERLRVEYGLRYSLFQNVGRSTVYSYDSQYRPADTTTYPAGEVFYANGGPEPRLSLRYGLGGQASLKASYNRTRQYLHLLSNSATGFSAFDVWYPSGPTVKPQGADQVSLGYYRNGKGNRWEASAEVYYKAMRNHIDYADYAALLYNPYLDGELRRGRAWAYGAEFLLKKPAGKLTGWLGYTYSRTFSQIPEINGGRPYPAGYDQPHSISLVSQYEASPRWSFACNWVYSTGRAVTLPTESFGFGAYNVPVFGGRNASRLPDYHRLDLSATLRPRPKPGRKYERSWTFAVYNAYARQNPLLIFLGPPLGSGPPFTKVPDPTKTAAHEVSLLPLIPSVTYNFKF